jgi:hypothetical protein
VEENNNKIKRTVVERSVLDGMDVRKRKSEKWKEKKNK